VAVTKYDFILTFRLPAPNAAPDNYLDALFEAGCDDASVGTGKMGMVGLEFSRRAVSAEDALRSAISNIQTAIPGAVLVEAGPDLVNLTDVAEIVGCTRQNMRKYAAGEVRAVSEGFPEPVFTGSPSLWHLAEIAAWLDRHAGMRPKAEVIEVAKATARVNLEVQERRVKRMVEPA
jgi:predicted DNA-binding transcriptional regulator AlpA